MRTHRRTPVTHPFHSKTLAYSSWTPPPLCLHIVPYRLRHSAMTPDIHYLPFYLSPSLLLWSPILPKPQTCLTTPHQFLDLAYTLYPFQVPISQPISLAYPLSFSSSPTPPIPIWTPPTHCYIFSAHFPLLCYASRKYVPLLHVTPFLIVDIPPVTLCSLSFFSLCLCSIATYISCL